MISISSKPAIVVILSTFSTVLTEYSITILPSVSPSLGSDITLTLPYSADNDVDLYPPAWENPIERVSPTPFVNIFDGVSGSVNWGTCPNIASIVVFADKVTEIVGLVESDPFHPIKPYPSLGVAVILIDVPSLYVPPAVETLPPSPADTVMVYWVTVGVGVGLVVFVGGAIYTDELSSVLSLAHVTNSRDNINRSVLFYRNWNILIRSNWC